VAEPGFSQHKGSEEKIDFAGKDLEKKSLSKILTSNLLSKYVLKQ